MADNYLEYRMEDMASGKLKPKKFVARKPKARVSAVTAAEKAATSDAKPAESNCAPSVMEKIASFTIDHTRLEPGVYVSRRDVTPSGDVVTTFDIRMTRPNREAALSPQSLHAMEHLAATFLRNHREWRDRIVYWGPMGCCTGNYLLVSGKYESRDILPLVIETMKFVADYEGEIPGATPRDCGNYSYMDPEAAKEAARKYLEETLLRAGDENLNYPC